MLASRLTRPLLRSRLPFQTSLHAGFRPRYVRLSRRSEPEDEIFARQISRTVPRDPRTGSVGYTVKAIIIVWVTYKLAVWFLYEPFFDGGTFDWLAQSTIFKLVGPQSNTKPRREAPEESARIYQPFKGKNEVRLLVLAPGNEDEEVQCRLINVELNWRARYEALSYHWGDPNVTVPIKCEGQTVAVTTNLHSALVDLRDATEPRYLWVDAICINQDDLDEKAKQIKLMGLIYSRARRVLIYLGRADREVSGALKDLAFLDSKFTALHVQRYMSRLAALGQTGTNLLSLFPSQIPFPDDFNWQPIVTLFRRHWFQRTWIIQEAILAKRGIVYCGRESIPWSKFETVVAALYMYHHTVKQIPGYDSVIDRAINGVNTMRLARRDRRKDRFRHFFIMRSERGQLNEYSGLLDLLLDTRQFQCTNPRDKIYGLMGIVRQNVNDEHLNPDYSFSVEQVYRNFVIWEIFANNNLRVLGCGSEKESESNFPSWVPDFMRLSPQQHLLRRGRRLDYNAGLDTKIQVKLSDDSLVLQVKGIVADRIHTVGTKEAVTGFALHLPRKLEDRKCESKQNALWFQELIQKKKWLDEAIVIYGEAYQRLASNGRPFIGDGHKKKLMTPATKLADRDAPPGLESFCRALIFNVDEFERPAAPVYTDMVAAFGILVGKSMRVEESYVAKWLPYAQLAERSLVRGAVGRRFAGTNEGLVGWVPQGTRRGDMVVVLYGSRVPFVLRKVGEGKYNLVGECYIHGLMAGEAVRAERRLEQEVNFALL
ncbi:hypothetical protein FALCPG4_015412 [Fusarium falciforme]